ncbi:MAG: hypothetical protein JWR04_1821 [Rhodoglobus sp.]|nr:hypothetical protein [Rhodoglobus sp.]
MGATLDQRTLADLLPGTWTIQATNFPMWLTGEKLEPRFTYDLVSEQPLVLSDDVSYVEEAGEKHILGQDTWNGEGFVWRGRKLLRLFASRWTVAGISDDGTIAVIHFSKSLATPSGVDVIVREGTHHPELRATIAHATEEFGLTPEEFGSLTWLAAAPTTG